MRFAVSIFGTILVVTGFEYHSNLFFWTGFGCQILTSLPIDFAKLSRIWVYWR